MTEPVGLITSLILTAPLVWLAYRPGRHAEVPTVPMSPDASAGASTPTTPAPVIAAAISEDAEHAAIRYAFDECGLPLHKLTDDFDVAATGKLNDVYHHASVKLGKAHPVRTVKAIASHLRSS